MKQSYISNSKWLWLSIFLNYKILEGVVFFKQKEGNKNK